MQLAAPLPVPHGLGPLPPGWAESTAADAALPPAAPSPSGEASDHAHDNAGAQIVARQPPSAADTAPSHDGIGSMPGADTGGAGDAAPLVPQQTIGLAVETTGDGSLAWRGYDPQAWQSVHAPDDRRPGRGQGPDQAPVHDHPGRDDGAATADPAPDERGDDSADDGDRPPGDDDPLAQLLDPASADWRPALAQALQARLDGSAPPLALLTAAAEWRRGRCVVLACPQADDPAGPAWAFVLWPRRPRPAGIEPGGPPRLPPLHGLQVTARLHWAACPPAERWWQSRLVKEHHPRRGRQLVAPGDAAATGGGHVPCDVQLGPVLAPRWRPCDVRVAIGAAQRFWSALDAQWSVQVVVCSQALVGPVPGAQEDAR